MIKRRVIYLCGPMTGLPQNNYPAFHAAAAELRAWGLEVVNPAENGLPEDAPYYEHLRRDLINLLTLCTEVALLPGWYLSRGAMNEIVTADLCKIHPIRELEKVLTEAKMGGVVHKCLRHHSPGLAGERNGAMVYCLLPVARPHGV